MKILLKLGRVRAILFDVDRNYGLRPFFKCVMVDGEYFIDTAYTRIIYTPKNWRSKEGDPYEH